MSSFTDMSVKHAQLRAIHRMLAFNDEAAASYESEYSLAPAGSSHNQWKILIYDTACRSIISPILSVQQLRRRGVTLHLLLKSEREPIPDVPAIYFCQPTKDILAIIAQDCAKGLYARAHLNFVTKLDRALMEDFAKLVVQSGCLQTIASVHDQYLDFVCLETRLFSLSKPHSYISYNGSGATEQVIEQVMTDIAYGLFSVVATVGQIPIIRCPRGGAPEMVARKLNRMIAEHPTLLRNKGGSSGGSVVSGSAASMTRPLLVILDRNADLMTPIQHTSTYQALIDDVLTHKANRVEFEVVQDPESKRPKKITKRFDLDPDEDPFYATHRFQPFPEAIESNAAELQEVTEREHEIRSKAGGGGSRMDAFDAMSSGGGGANDLASAVDSLPALLDRKKKLEVHTSILQAVMNEVAARDVPQFYELESALATGGYKNDAPKAKKDVLTLVADAAKGNVQDKLRLIFVYAVATGARTSDLDEVTAAMKQASENKAAEDKAVREQLVMAQHAVSYLKQLRSMHMIPAAADMLQEFTATDTSSSAVSSTMLSSLMAKATTQATGLLAKATDKVTSMLGKIHKHHATVVVENLCDMRPGTEDESYLYLDPKVRGDVDVRKLQGVVTRATIREAICFVIGGGCYGEYQNLQMLRTERRNIAYGSTELMDANAFLTQLSQLGQK